MQRQARFSTVVVLLAGIMASLLTSFLLLEHNIQPIIVTIGRKKAKIMATRAMNQAVRNSVAGKVKYDDLVKRHFDQKGQVTDVEANWVEIDRIKTDMTRQLQDQLASMKALKFGLPLGQIFGSQIFATTGPVVPISIVPLGVAKVSVKEKFTASGINQTRHIIELVLQSNMQIVFPLYKGKMTVTDVTPLAETVIVGPVPDTYMNLNLGKLGTGTINGGSSSGTSGQ